MSDTWQRVAAAQRGLRTPVVRFPATAIAIVLATSCGDPAAPTPESRRVGMTETSHLNVTPTAPARIAAGSGFVCALRPLGGAAGCWGVNGSGQAPYSKPAASSFFTQISAHAQGSHACAVRDDGVVECWGDNLQSQAPATKSATTGTFTQVSAGYAHTCGLRTDGKVECWGFNDFLQAPDEQSATSGTFTQVAAGGIFTCALTSTGAIECWGDDTDGVATPPAGTFTHVSAGTQHACAVRDDGVVACWGTNTSGAAPATQEPVTSTFVQVSAAASNTCAIRADATVECWGSNVNLNAPETQSATAGVFAQVAAGQSTTCALRAQGVIAECWGDNGSNGATPGLIPLALTSFDVTPAFETGSIDLTWDGGVNSYFYRVERRVWINGTWSPWSLAGETEVGTFAFSDTEVSTESRYRYRVRGCTPAGCGPLSQSVVIAPVAPPAPADLIAMPVGGQSWIDVIWNDGVGETSYRVQGRVWDDWAGAWLAWSPTVVVAADANMYTDMAAGSGRYGYRVRACNAICSEWALTAPLTTAVIPAAPGAPTGSVISEGIDVTWADNSADETSFLLQRRIRNQATGAWGEWQRIARLPANTTSHEDELVEGADQYRYRVRACNAAGCSASVRGPIVDAGATGARAP